MDRAQGKQNRQCKTPSHKEENERDEQSFKKLGHEVERRRKKLENETRYAACRSEKG